MIVGCYRRWCVELTASELRFNIGWCVSLYITACGDVEYNFTQIIVVSYLMWRRMQIALR